jgi:hypothetical protein
MGYAPLPFGQGEKLLEKLWRSFREGGIKK